MSKNINSGMQFKNPFGKMNSEGEDIFLIATGRYMIKRKRYKVYKNSRRNRWSLTKPWLLNRLSP